MNTETKTATQQADKDEPGPSRLKQIWNLLFGKRTENKESVLSYLRLAHQKKILDADALSIIEGAMQVGDMQVREIMVPRNQIISIKHNQDTKELLQTIVSSGHSRFPVLAENSEEVQGVLLAKDLLALQLNETNRFNIKDKMRQPTFIPESKRVNVLLKEFRDKRNHMAIVLNEYGGIAGLVTIEDVLEQIVGEIEDEHDIEDSAQIKEISSNEFVVKSNTPVDDFNEFFNSNFSDTEFETIAGIVLKQFGRLPERNESIEIEGLLFTVLNADNRSIRLLQVAKLETSQLAKTNDATEDLAAKSL